MRSSYKETALTTQKENYETSNGFKSINDTSEANSVMKTTNTFDNLKVVIRVRPALPREMEVDLPFRSVVLVTNDNKSCNLVEYLGAELSERERQREWVENPNLFQLHRFTFDCVFDMDSSQQEVYEQTAKPAVMSILEGYNSTIFAYGQTGTGKTFTMEGFTFSSTDMLRGIIPRSIEEIFSYIESQSNSDTKFMVRASYLQIYNESISDLLKPEKSSLQIREDKKKGVFVEALSEWAVRTPADIYTLLQRGTLSRATASTKMNDVSSRSHAVFVVTVEQMTIVEDERGEAMTQIKVGKLNLVDLAGSERIRVTGATGKQLEESKKINKSLSALGNVIYALTDTKGRTHIPYRDSKLTRLLEDSLGGNCKTTMMAMISPSHDSFNESLSTLHFSRRAKNIKNRPKINEDVDHRTLIRQYEVELKKLRTELDEKNRQIHSNELIIQLEEEKKRAEEDKHAAIEALEQASKQYLQEREEKKRLETKISMMNSQVIVGGHKIEDTPQFRSALEERQTILLKEFDEKLQEFEKERQQLEEDKAQVERYKQLLLKQRDIMIALTNKLNERDEAIVQLQEELDAYDKINREQEEMIANKNNRVTSLENILRRNNIRVPDDLENKIEKDKHPGRGKLDKVYFPYEAEKNGKEYENQPITLLSPEEKIRELKNIVTEQEREIQILKLVSEKFMNSVDTRKTNVKDLVNKVEKDYESNYKFSKIEDEKHNLIKKLEQNIDMLNFQRQENEVLTEELFQYEKNIEKLEAENNQMFKIKDDIVVKLDRVIKRMDTDNNIRNVRNELVKIIQVLLESSNEQKNKNVMENNIIAEEDEFVYNETRERNDSTHNKKPNYIMQNYEKFKESQESSKRVQTSEKKSNSVNNNNGLRVSNNSNQQPGVKPFQSLTPNRKTEQKSTQFINCNYINQSGSGNSVRNELYNVNYVQKNISQNNKDLNTSNSKLKTDTYINKFINSNGK